MVDEKPRGVRKRQIPLKAEPSDVARVDAYKRKYGSSIGKGGAARVLLLMGLREADRRGSLDLSVLDPAEKLEPDSEHRRNRSAAQIRGKSKAARD